MHYLIWSSKLFLLNWIPKAFSDPEKVAKYFFVTQTDAVSEHENGVFLARGLFGHHDFSARHERVLSAEANMWLCHPTLLC